MQNELNFADSPSSDRLSEGVLKWITRCYESMEEWKLTAADLFFASNGDSNLSRNRLAAILRSHFLDSPPKAEDVDRWKTGFSEIETVHIVPPKISVSNSPYVDWVYIADYLLLACASPTTRLEDENQRRDTDFQNVMGSYLIRKIVHDARDRMRNDASLPDADILEAIQELDPKASMANIKEARRLEKSQSAHSPPKKPLPSDPMPRYTALYF